MDLGIWGRVGNITSVAVRAPIPHLGLSNTARAGLRMIPPVTGSTRVFGIIADPVHHVRTPALFNQALAARGIDAVMLPVHVAPAGLAAFLAGLRHWQNLDGLVVTVPYKVAAAALCDRLSPQARMVGAVNVIRRGADGVPGRGGRHGAGHRLCPGGGGHWPAGAAFSGAACGIGRGPNRP